MSNGHTLIDAIPGGPFRCTESGHDTKATRRPDIWGPRLWYILHNTSIFYPEKPEPKERGECLQGLLAIPFYIPCRECKGHAKEFLDEHLSSVQDRDRVVSCRVELFQFVVNFHNRVNIRNKGYEMPYSEVLALML